MLRIFMYRSFWSGCLFASGMVLFVAALLIPTEDRFCFAFLSVFVTGGSLLIQATQPLILVLRRSVNGPVDVMLADVILPRALRYGRPVWLENPRDEMVRGQLFRFSPFALYSLPATLGAIAIWSLRSVGPLQVVVLLIVALIGTILLLDASVGNSAAGAVAFLGAICAVAPIPAQLPSFGQVARSLGMGVLVFVVIYGIFSLGHALRVSRMSPIGKSVRNVVDRLWLHVEMWLPLCFVTRYIHGGPAVIREVTSEEPDWYSTVFALMRRTTHAIMDVSKLEPKSGLEWELKTCFKRRIKLLLMCHESNSLRVLANVRSAIPRATILPDDCYDLKRLEQLVEEPGAPPVMFCVYGDAGVVSKVEFHIGVFFGEISLSDYFHAFYASAK